MENRDMETINHRKAAMSKQDQTQENKISHMPENSLFYEKIIPTLMIVMGIVTVALIVFAVGVLLGFIKF